MSIATGEFENTFDVPTLARNFAVTPDGRYLTYSLPTKGTENVWSIPMGGGPPKQVTGFKPETTNRTLFRFAWSLDGKRLAMARGDQATDVVLIKDFR
jgi:Tol biopolymer transport system component